MRNTIKKASILLIIMIIATLFAVSVNAEDSEWVKRLPEDKIEYNYNKDQGLIILKGEGTLYRGYFGYGVPSDEEEFEYPEEEETFPDIVYESDNIKTVIVQEGITKIDKYVFSALHNVETVVLPDSVESIGYGAFNLCQKLRSVNLPEGLKTIEGYAFAYCKSLKNVSFPATLERIEGYAFRGAGLKYAYVPENVNYLGYGVFENCDSMKKITFTQKRCQMIGCDSLEEIVYPADFARVVPIAVDCKNLKKVTFPSVEKIGTVKIAKDSYDKFLTGCPDAVLGYVNIDMVKNTGVNHAVVTPLNKNVGQVKGLRVTQKDIPYLQWDELEGAGYYQVYYKNNGKWEKIYSGSDTKIFLQYKGEYKVRAVSYDGKNHAYGKYVTIKTKVVDGVYNLKFDGKVLSWDKAENATGYQVFYCTEDGGSYKKIGNTSKTSMDISKYKNVYAVKIRAYAKTSTGTLYSGYTGCYL